MNTKAVAPTPQRQSSLLAAMAEKYHMDPQTFATTVRKTCMPANATNEEFAAFMMVARDYNLNPILKEIHAFPKKGGGIQPIVSIDGWISLINQHPQCDGYRFEWFRDDKGNLLSCKCVMFRKDRRHPVEAEEYLLECKRPTEPWKMEHRMLRHRALIQAARMAFGFSGVMDEDEAATTAAMRDITPPPRPQMADFAASAQPQPAVKADPETGELPADENPIPEFGAADAYQLGHECRVKGGVAADCPRHLAPEHQEAWRHGFEAADEELAA